MRWIALLCALAGCELVFTLESPSSSVPTFVATSDTTTSRTLTVERPATVVAGDLIVAIIQNRVRNLVTMTVRPPGWTALSDHAADSCNDGWHAWFLSGTAADETSYDFEFNMTDEYSALFVVYRGLSIARFVRFELGGEKPAEGEVVTFPSGPAVDGSTLFIGEVATRPLTVVPPDLVQRGVHQNIVALDRSVTGDQLPEVTLPIPADNCVGFGEAVLER